MAVARQAAAEALQTVFATPPAEPEGTEPGTAAAPPTPVSRRGFFRRLAGRQV
jgi:hypothetical protein